MDLSTQDFYDRLAEDYHLIFGGWDEEVRQQGEILDRLLRTETGRRERLSILDCSCGIGTQAIGLALRGHRLTATDLSPRAVERARREAERFAVEIAFGTADFRALEESVEGTFDAVISCDNALPHMISRDDLLAAVRSIRSRVREGGLFLASIRDYDELLRERPRVTTPKVMETPEGRRVYFQVWDWEDDSRAYVVNLFLLSEEGENWRTVHHTTRYRAMLRSELRSVLEEVGFSDVDWKMPDQSSYYQPVVTAKNQRA
jgi:glycine/sarcosine N-methyltransferase